jgi:hypothetical protein
LKGNNYKQEAKQELRWSNPAVISVLRLGLDLKTKIFGLGLDSQVFGLASSSLGLDVTGLVNT